MRALELETHCGENGHGRSFLVAVWNLDQVPMEIFLDEPTRASTRCLKFHGMERLEGSREMVQC